MWLDLVPIHTVLDTTLPQIANPSGIAHGVALLVAWLVLTFYYVRGATFYIVTVSRLGGLGTNFFHTLHAVACGCDASFWDLAGLMSPVRRRRNGQGAALSAG